MAFQSLSDNLVADDTNVVDDVFVKNLESGAIVRANTASDGTEANAFTFIPWGPALSANGRYVAFFSAADNLVADGGGRGLFVKDLETGSIVRANTASDGTLPNDNFVLGQGISAGGRTVAFSTGAGNLVPDDTNGLWDVFIKDLDLGKVVRASTAADGTQAQG